MNMTNTLFLSQVITNFMFCECFEVEWYNCIPSLGSNCAVTKAIIIPQGFLLEFKVSQLIFVTPPSLIFGFVKIHQSNDMVW